jgi:hypothetical protein
MTGTEVLRRITTALEQAGIQYMLSGSFASSYYGSPRTTQDLDIIISATPTQLRAFIGGLPKHWYYADLDAALEAHKRESMFNLIDILTGWKIDLIIRKSRPFSQEEFGRRQMVNLQGPDVFVASAEDMIISKLEWAKLGKSQRHIEDVAAMLRVRWSSMNQPYVERWIRDLGLDPEWISARHAAGIA